MVTLPPLLVSTDFGTCSYQCFLSNCIPVSLHMLKCSGHTFYRVFLCTVLLPVQGMLILCGILSHQIFGKVCICCLFLCSIFFLLSISLLLLLLLLLLLFTPTEFSLGGSSSYISNG